MSNKYINNEGMLCFFKKCSVCGCDVLSIFNGHPETHNKECERNQKIYKLKELKKGVLK